MVLDRSRDRFIMKNNQKASKTNVKRRVDGSAIGGYIALVKGAIGGI